MPCVVRKQLGTCALVITISFSPCTKSPNPQFVRNAAPAFLRRGAATTKPWAYTTPQAQAAGEASYVNNLLVREKNFGPSGPKTRVHLLAACRVCAVCGCGSMEVWEASPCSWLRRKVDALARTAVGSVCAATAREACLDGHSPAAWCDAQNITESTARGTALPDEWKLGEQEPSLRAGLLSVAHTPPAVQHSSHFIAKKNEFEANGFARMRAAAAYHGVDMTRQQHVIQPAELTSQVVILPRFDMDLYSATMGRHITQHDAVGIVRDVVRGVAVLGECALAHIDLAPTNVCVFRVRVGQLAEFPGKKSENVYALSRRVMTNYYRYCRIESRTLTPGTVASTANVSPPRADGPPWKQAKASADIQHCLV